MINFRSSITSLVCALLVITCSPYKSHQTDLVNDITKTDSVLTDIEPAIKTNTEQNDSCVFNNDYKTLTMDWVKELNASGFVWRDEIYSAIKVVDQDTISLSQGGCYHFGVGAEWSLVDAHPATDSAYWISKALELAKEYKLDDYIEFITDRRLIQREGTNNEIILYDVIDTVSVTNRVFDGIVITERGERKTLSLSMYFN